MVILQATITKLKCKNTKRIDSSADSVCSLCTLFTDGIYSVITIAAKIFISLTIPEFYRNNMV